MGDVYDTDILEWSEQHAELLRRRAAGELVNEAELDWPNVAEEVESVGREQLQAVASLLVQALAHDLKAEAWPLSREVPGWRAEARRFRGDAAARFTPQCASGWTWRSFIGARCGRCPTRSTASRRFRCR